MLNISEVLNDMSEDLTLAKLYLDLNSKLFDPIRGYECYSSLIDTISKFIPDEPAHTEYLKRLYDISINLKNQNDQASKG